MRYKDLFIDFDDTLYDMHGNSMIGLKKLFDEQSSRYRNYSSNILHTESLRHGAESHDGLRVHRTS